MPTAHYIPLSALADNGLHPSNPNRTIETAPRLDVNVPRSNPQLASNNCGNNPRTMDVTKDGNSNSNVKNSQNEKKNCRVRFIDRVEALGEYKEKQWQSNVQHYYWPIYYVRSYVLLSVWETIYNIIQRPKIVCVLLVL